MRQRPAHTHGTHESHNSGRPLTRYNGSDEQGCACVWRRHTQVWGAKHPRAPAAGNHDNGLPVAAANEDEYIYTLLA